MILLKDYNSYNILLQNKHLYTRVNLKKFYFNNNPFYSISQLVIDQFIVKNFTNNIMSNDDDIRKYYESKQLKNNGVALVFAVILGLLGFMGIGHIYIGKVGKGLAYLISGFIVLGGGFTLTMFLSIMTFVIGMMIFIILFIHQILSVRRDCNKFNDYFIRTKKKLW